MTTSAPAAPVQEGSATAESATGRPVGGRTPSRGFARLTVAAAVVTYLLIVVGGVVRVSGSGLGCGATGQDWPLCHGGLVPPPDINTLIEFSHRCFATASTILVALVLVVGWLRYRHVRRIVVPASLAAVFFVIQILLGAVTVELKLPGEVVMAHLANAEFLLATLLYIAVATRAARRGAVAAGVVGGADGTVVAAAAADDAGRAALAGRRRTARAISAAAALTTYLLVLSGAFVVANGAGFACSGWPLCGGGFAIDSSHMASINLFHRLVAGVAVFFAGFAMGKVLRAFRGDRGVTRTAMAVNVLLLLQVLAGAVLVKLQLPPWTRGVHLALASALWAMVALTALLVRDRTGADAVATTALPADRVPRVGSPAVAP